MPHCNTKYIGKVLLEFDELPSTNDYLRSFAQQTDTPEGVVVQALRQTAGRGQMGTVWESAPGQNLTLSILLKPQNLPADAHTLLSKLAALAVWDTLQQWASQLPVPPGEMHIKWPNDLWIERRKVCGILIENTLSGGFISHSIIGIGLNVNQQQFSPALAGATSLKQWCLADVDIEALRCTLLEALERRYDALRCAGEGDGGLSREYLQYLYGYQTPLTYRTIPEGEVFSGSITGVDQEGRLCIDDGQQLRRFTLKTVCLHQG